MSASALHPQESDRESSQPAIRQIIARFSGSAVGSLGTFTCIFLGSVFLGNLESTKPSPNSSVYSFDPRADALLRELFPRKIRVAGVTNAFLERGTTPSFHELNGVFEYHSQAMNHAESSIDAWELDADPLDSPWLGIEREPGWQRSLMRHAITISDLASQLAHPVRPFKSSLEKALFQRDVLQMCMIVQEAIQAEDNAQERKCGEVALKELIALWKLMALSEDEFEALVRLRPKIVVESKFTSDSRFDLSDGYLPIRVIGAAPGWYAMPFGDQASLHFKDFGGRSFVRVFIKPAGWTEPQFHRYWDQVAEKFGANVTRDGSVPPLPARTETMLVRSFGVFLTDGSYVDSGFPEEVLMRLFKYDETRLDLATSDYRGTLLYRYKMQRRRLLADPRSLGLRRVLDDEPQFFGFLSEVPDYRRAYSAHLTTMRNNCIGCHSELYYGASTVFTLGRKRPMGVDSIDMEGRLLRHTQVSGRFKLATREFLVLQNHWSE